MVEHAPRLKRAYAVPASADGTRVLVERLWPRGLTKEAVAVDHWLKDAAPARTCENGTATTRPAGPSSKPATVLLTAEE